MTQAGKKKKRAANRSILLAKKIIIKDGGTVSGRGRGGEAGRPLLHRSLVSTQGPAWRLPLAQAAFLGVSPIH